MKTLWGPAARPSRVMMRFVTKITAELYQCHQGGRHRVVTAHGVLWLRWGSGVTQFSATKTSPQPACRTQGSKT